MSARTTSQDAAGSGPEQSDERVLPAVLTVLALAAQAIVLFFTFVMGLGWGGFTYVAALLQASLAFGLIGRLAARKRGAVLLVPVLSAALTGALSSVGQAHGRATACSDQVRAAAQQLAPPPGATVVFEGEYTEGCVARTRMSLTNKEIVQHYQAEFARLGWQDTPGRHDSTIGVAAVKNGIHMLVEVNSGQEGGSQMFEVVAADPASTSPCSVNTVDAYLHRQPTTGLEPGWWVVLTSTTDGPASVVIRDSTAAVVLERQADPRPEDHADMERLERASEGFPGLTLTEGAYAIECRRGDGRVTTAALPVTWGQDEQEKSVVVRAFETPEHWK